MRSSFEIGECGSVFDQARQSNVQWSSETRNLGTDQSTCFGSIVDVEAQLCSVGQPGYLLREALRTAAQHLVIVQTGEYFSLEYGGNIVARLNKGLCRILQQLYTGWDVTFQAFTTDHDRKLATERTWTIFHVEINIYGRIADAENIGGLLSKSRTFLQRPRYGLEFAEYHNPHFLQIDGHEESPHAETSVSLTTTMSYHPPERNLENDLAAKDSATAVDRILNSLSHHVVRPNLPIDRRIKSSLLPYQHVFSGAKRPQQEETKGGIIADDMGLGKSLVILSTVAGSLDRADQFFDTQSQLHSSGSSNKIPSKATLIVAPSSLLIDNWVDEIWK
ncbi:hypothetical protein QQS21_003370 [Conoideocrella luteorostrata]|uniref:SNF2 N-terminal domain-containing protein n=1 Tax=Conoideocrella luteorostrata TaxID=1105319 RepID=A0AAJ0G0M4_9HYPO|nr:hypothetical protein QQS21_003370 [Conoideocrella luteorostrata]